MKVLDERLLIEEMLKLFGVTTTARLLGWCVVTVARLPADAQSERGMLEHGFGSVSTRYRNVGKLRELKRHLERRGFVVADDAATMPEVRALSWATPA